MRILTPVLCTSGLAAEARVARAAGFQVIVGAGDPERTMADPSTRELPPAALIPLAENGTPAIIRVAAEVLRRPRQIASLFGLARETHQALSALAGPARALRLAFASI